MTTLTDQDGNEIDAGLAGNDHLLTAQLAEVNALAPVAIPNAEPDLTRATRLTALGEVVTRRVTARLYQGIKLDERTDETTGAALRMYAFLVERNGALTPAQFMTRYPTEARALAHWALEDATEEINAARQSLKEAVKTLGAGERLAVTTSTTRDAMFADALRGIQNANDFNAVLRAFSRR